MRLQSLFVLAIFCVAFASTDALAESPSLPSEALVGDRRLSLNGKAVRTVWGFPVYEVGLYLAAPNRDADAIMGRDPEPKRVRMQMLRAVEKKDFVSTVRENIEQNLSDEEQRAFASQLDAYIGHLEKGGDIEPGRVITIDYVPGKGTVLALDGREVGTIAGHDFYHIMLRLWIGRPLQASIKEGLLGGG